MKYKPSLQWRQVVKEWAKLVFVLVVCCPQIARASKREPYINRLMANARAMQLAESVTWRRMLFIPDRIGQGGTSIIDEPEYFLAENGRYDPEAELEATLNGFLAPQSTGVRGDEHVRCRHPARWTYLSRALGIRAHDLPPIQCKSLDEFLGRLRYDRVSLVFSNYFMNNPASLFGHSFLKLHRVRGKGEADQPLLDDVVNFSAAVDDDYSLLYPFKGLLGGYWGFFSLFPYHRKIQEYNNFESRDLWEFDLKLTPDEVQRLELMVWELGGARISYYYVHQNCSYVMLSLLESAAPRLQLTKQFQIYAVPSDTVRAVALTPDILTGVYYRPSAESRYVLRLKALSPQENLRLKRLIDADEPDFAEFTKDCDKYCQARVIDAALEYFDFTEKLAGARTADKYFDLRQKLLLKRAGLGIKSPPLPDDPVSSRVDFGHDSALIGGALGYQSSDGPFVDLSWRPALQDVSANAVGYQQQMEVKFLDITVRKFAERQGLTLRRLDLLEVTSLHTDLPLITNYAWSFGFGGEDGFGFGSEAAHMRSFVQWGLGKAVATDDQRFLAYTLVGTDFGHASTPDNSWHAGPRIVAGMIYKVSSRLKLLARAEAARYFNPDPIDRIEQEASAVLTVARNRDFRIRVNRRSAFSEITLGVRQYF